MYLFMVILLFSVYFWVLLVRLVVLCGFFVLFCFVFCFVFNTIDLIWTLEYKASLTLNFRSLHPGDLSSKKAGRA